VRRRALAPIFAGALLIAAFAVGCSGGSSSSSASPDETVAEPPTTQPSTTDSTVPERRYSLVRTRRCLEDAGFPVGPVGKANPRLQALGDLAQRTSLAVRSGGEVVGLAFGDAGLLAQLLAVPNDPYTIETRGNVLLLYRPVARRQASLVRGCLRP
jgi:hypothetical protein